MSDATKDAFQVQAEQWRREEAEEEAQAQQERARAARKGEVAQVTGEASRLLGGLQVTPDAPIECGARAWGAELESGEEACDRLAHYTLGPDGSLEVVRRCPGAVKAEARGLIDRERARLEGVLRRIGQYGTVGFKGYERNGEGADAAYRAAREFALGKPPMRNLFFVGPTGLGKTRLLVGSHFALLSAGVRSVYVTSPELRAAFDDSRSFDEEIQDRGRSFVERLVRAQAVHLDDIGNVEDDERKRGSFAEGVKNLLDRSVGAWFAATNLTWEEALAHPDVGRKLMSRLCQGAIVRLAGPDYRIAHAERVR